MLRCQEHWQWPAGGEPRQRLETLRGTTWGRTFAVKAPRELGDLLRCQLPSGWRPTDRSPERVWTIQRDAAGHASAWAAESLLLDRTTTGDAVRAVTDDLELWAAEHAEGRIVVHAGVVVIDGYAIVLPGPSRAGKSTLVAALVRAGATYYSDEFAPFDASGRVSAYPRPPRQRPDSPAHAWEAESHPGHPHEPNPAADRPSVPVGVVAAVRFRRDVDVAFTPTSPGDAVMQLLRNTVSALSRRAEALDVLSRAATTALAVVGVRGDATQCAEALLELWANHPKQDQPFDPAEDAPLYESD